jgi:uncharacterized damage-inducible protein DinB
MEAPEVWLRGPLTNIPPLLQPVAHALLQAGEEVEKFMQGFPTEKLWEKPAGVASPGFHLQHMAGVIDRLFTYARNESLTDEQFQYLRQEGAPASANTTVNDLVAHLNKRIQICLRQLEATPEASLLTPVAIGRKRLPSNVLGVLFHAAEHIQRHMGQLLVTVRVLKE